MEQIKGNVENMETDGENSVTSNATGYNIPALPLTMSEIFNRNPIQSNCLHEQWNYNDRRQCQELTPGLFFGPYASASKQARDRMIELGLTHVVCVRSLGEFRVVKPNHEDKFKYLIVEYIASQYNPLIPAMREVIPFLDDCFEKNGRALIHGNVGMSRSAVIAAAYIMWRNSEMEAVEAARLVHEKRCCAHFDQEMFQLLSDFHCHIKATRDLKGTTPNTESRKRNADEFEEQPS